ncbi:MAG: hypothetical protein V3U78_04450, partial [Thiotrichaceae bacterium]
TWDQETKEHWIKTMQEHQDADRLVQGRWFKNGRGCFFGCAMQTDENALPKAIAKMKLPAQLVYLAEQIFERLPQKEALKFPVELCKAIPVNVDITNVFHQLSILRLRPLAEKNPAVAKEINGVIKCCELAIAGGMPDWAREARAARAARAAREARAARAAGEAWAAWEAGEAGEARAAWEAWEAGADFWVTERDNLLNELRSAA